MITRLMKARQHALFSKIGSFPFVEPRHRGMQFFSVLDADGELAREKDPHMTGNPDSDSDSEGQMEAHVTSTWGFTVFVNQL